MNRRGVLYDVGRVLYGNWRPDYRPDVVQRELQIIADDLHCTAVKICGRSLTRLTYATEVALDLGLEVWFAPELWGRSPSRTLAYLVAAARAARTLYRRQPDKIVLSVGTELSLFMRGILPGRTLHGRIRYMGRQPRTGRPCELLNPFLREAVAAVRPLFPGPITYAAIPSERVDWRPFDIAGLNHYWNRHVADRYLEILDRLRPENKPLVVSEFGVRTRTGADQTGGEGPENVTAATVALHLIPGVRRLTIGPAHPAGPISLAARRLVRPRVRTVHERNETHQAQALVRQLSTLDSAGIDGAFIHTFVSPSDVHGDSPRFDLDTDSFALVKPLPFGRRGTTYRDLGWEPKEAFRAVAAYYASEYGGPPIVT